MSKTLSALGERVWEMPPLILHLFNQRVPADSLLENSRAALMLSGLYPATAQAAKNFAAASSLDAWARSACCIFSARISSAGWTSGVESVRRIPEYDEAGIRTQSFAGLLISDTPGAVKENSSDRASRTTMRSFAAPSD